MVLLFIGLKLCNMLFDTFVNNRIHQAEKGILILKA